jgi:hypothetical protein
VHEVGDEVSEALVVGDDLPQGVDVSGDGHGREHPPLAPRHHVHVALHAGRRALLCSRAAAAMVLVVVGAPVVAGGGGGRGDDRTAGRGPQQRRRTGRRAVARVRSSRDEGNGGRGESSHRSCVRAGESVLALGVGAWRTGEEGGGRGQWPLPLSLCLEQREKIKVNERLVRRLGPICR